MALPLDQLDLLATPDDLLAGAPLQLPIDAIEEDPDQPRQEFDPEGLAELAETIRERGVRQPISVRRHPDKPDRWMLNFGARRLRASKLIGKFDIPAFVDNTADSYDQVIENEQREGLRPLELALFVQKRLALGDRQADVAKHLGKSRQWVTLATALIEAPDWLLQAYREERCRGMNELYELRRLHGQHAEAVEAWVAGQREPITRDRLAELRAALTPEALPQQTVALAANPGAPTPVKPSRPRPAPERSSHTDQRIHVEFDGQDYQLVVSVAPGQPGHMYVRPLLYHSFFLGQNNDKNR